LTQTYTREVRLEKWASGQLVARESYTLRGSMYLREELLLMLQVAGFEPTSVHGAFTPEPATARHQELVFTAQRPWRALPRLHFRRPCEPRACNASPGTRSSSRC